MSSSVVPPSLIVRLLSTVSSGSTVCGSLSTLEARLRILMRDDRGPRILERLAAGDVVEVVVAVDHVLDRLVGDLLDLLDIGRHRLRTPVADRVGGDHARRW